MFNWNVYTRIERNMWCSAMRSTCIKLDEKKMWKLCGNYTLTCGRSFGSIKMLEMTRNETALNCVTVAKTVLASFLSRRDHVAPKH